MEDDVKAEAALSQLIADQPDYYPAVFALGQLKDSSGDKSQARQLYEKTLKINHQHISALNNLAYLLTENYNDPKGALELAVRAYRQMPSSPEIIETLGFVLVKNGRYEEAVPLLEKANEVIPDNPAVQLHLGMAYQGIGRNESARDLLKKVLVAGNHDAAREARRMLQAST
jgi:FimV-like protein